jgi:hypothetical protein
MEKPTSLNEQVKSHMERHPELYSHYDLPKAVYVRDPTRTVLIDRAFVDIDDELVWKREKDTTPIQKEKETYTIVGGLSRVLDNFVNICKKSYK